MTGRTWAILIIAFLLFAVLLITIVLVAVKRAEASAEAEAEAQAQAQAKAQAELEAAAKATATETENAPVTFPGDITGFNLANMPYSNVPTLDECYRLCREDPACHAVTWRSTDKNCWLKQGTANKDKVTQGAKFVIDNTAFAGFDVPNSPVTVVKSSDQCYDQCRASTDCQWSTWTKSNGTCRLKATKPTPQMMTRFKRTI